MGLFVPEDPNYDESVRQTGFYRYRQLLSLHAGDWCKLGLVTLGGCLPLAAAIFCAIQASSVLLLIPGAFVGGMLAGPFLACLYDALLRGMRDDFTPWQKSFRRAWRQNWRASLLPGGLSGLFAGVAAFMGMLFYWAEQPPSSGTVSLYLFSMLLLLGLSAVYWPQLVLFEQRAAIRLRNCILFFIRHFWCVMGVSLLQLVYLAIFVLFAPWTLLLLPVLGLWYMLFLSQLLLYGRLDTAFQIEAAYGQAAQSAADNT